MYTQNKRHADRGVFWMTLGTFLVAMTSTAHASADWVSHYVGPNADEDVPAAIHVGSGERITVAGASDGLGSGADFVTVQYDASGNQAWASRYDGGSGDDFAMDVLVSSVGTTLVTGVSEGSDSTDYATVKYDTDGAEVWASRYAGPGGMDEAVALGTDDLGSVFVTGTSQSADGDLELATVKYDSDGAEVWVVRFGAGLGFQQEARDLFVASNGDVVVVATVALAADTTGSSYDYLILRYASDSTLLWSTIYDGPAGGYDEVQAGALDGAGNLYVTGVSEGEATGLDYCTVKLDVAGVLQWVTRHDGSASGDDIAFALDVDEAGSIVVTGSTTGESSGSDLTTVRYDEDGGTLWSATYDGPSSKEDTGFDVSFASDGSAYVTGASWAGDDEGTTGMATLRYTANGDLDWVERYDVDDSTYVEPMAIAVDLSGNAFVAGAAFDPDENLDFLTLAYLEGTTTVPEISALPSRVELAQNFPNPVVDGTRIALALPTNGKVELRVFDVSGRSVQTLLNREEAAGYHNLHWDTEALSSGTYFYRLRCGKTVLTRKMIVID